MRFVVIVEINNEKIEDKKEYIKAAYRSLVKCMDHIQDTEDLKSVWGGWESTDDVCLEDGAESILVNTDLLNDAICEAIEEDDIDTSITKRI